MADLTFGQAIEKVARKLMPAQRDQAVVVESSYTADGGTIQLTGDQINVVHAGSQIGIDQELLFVESFNATTNVATVVPGYAGTTPASHTAGTLVYVDPKFSRFDIGVAINDALSEMSSPDCGLFQVPPAAEITFNPVFIGYDLGGVPANFIDILEINYKIVPPTHDFPRVKSWRVMRNIPDPIFPSGRGIVLYDGGYPGLPIYVSYSAPFTPLVNLTDGLNAVAGVPLTALDIPIWGAEIDLTLTREVKRNFIESQPDARKAPEVPPAATSNAAFALMRRWQMKIDQEADRLARQYPSVHRGW